MKFLGGFIIILVILLSLAVYAGHWLKKNIGTNLADILNSFRIDKKGYIGVDKETKEKLKEKVKEIDDKIYQKAAEYNPAGDVLPDELDDAIRAKLKEEAKEKIKTR